MRKAGKMASKIANFFVFSSCFFHNMGTEIPPLFMLQDISVLVKVDDYVNRIYVIYVMFIC